MNEKYGRLTPVKLIHNTRGMWLWRCDCGTEKLIRRGHVTGGKIQSCGCYAKELTSSRGKHWESKKTSEYKSWASMIARCRPSANQQSMRNYYLRGIRVCDRWSGEDGYVNFLTDMGRKPSPQHSIERKNNSLGYSPDNCKWATKQEQSINTRRNRYLAYRGVIKTITEWGKEIGITRKGIEYRLDVMNMTVEQAFEMPRTKPIRGKAKKYNQLEREKYQ